MSDQPPTATEASPWNAQNSDPNPLAPVSEQLSAAPGANELDEIFQALLTRSVSASERTQLKLWRRRLGWLDSFKRRSHLLIAVIEPGTWAIRDANDYFCQFTGVSAALAQEPKPRLSDLFQDLDGHPPQDLYLRHLLYLILRDVYQLELRELHPFEQPMVASLSSPLYAEPRLVEFWLHPDELKIAPPDAPLPDLGAWAAPQLSAAELEEKLRDPQHLQSFARHLGLERYRVERIQGSILFEGSDVTVREMIRRINQLLIDRDSILRPEKFQQLNQWMRSLFRANNSIILSAEGDQAQLFKHADNHELEITTHSLQALQHSHFLRALEANQLSNVGDLAQDCQTDCERALLGSGVRSMLLMPLVVPAAESGTGRCQVVGLVGLTSAQPNHFNRGDCRWAEQLVPSFTMAVRQAVRQRFNQIHPAVEWRFLQEAERRTWGLPPELIVFSQVYPLYGLSDIRGSSNERNRAIQTDLLEQFRLGLRVLETASQAQATAFGTQLRLDLLDYIAQVRSAVTVDMEVTALQYLRERLELHFDYFAQAGPEAEAAVAAYRQACANEHRGVYQARARYDWTVSQINALLRRTWDHWQAQMQRIVPHYCDVQSTDGIDHMIYTGAAITPQFCPFHLRSLRYEQLRAMCDCARATLDLRSQCDTEMAVAHLVLVQDSTVDIFHDENTEKLFDVRGSHDTRYEIVKKRIEKAKHEDSQTRITQPGMLTLVYSTEEEWAEYQEYLRYLIREGWIAAEIQCGNVEPLQGVSGLKFARVAVLPASNHLST